MKILPSLVVGCLLIAPSVQAALVWQDDFNRATVTPYDYMNTTPTATPDYSASAGTIISSSYVNLSDTNSSQLSLRVHSDQFSGLPLSDGDSITVSYDFRVNSLNTNGSAASLPRFSIMNGNITGGNEAFGIGFGYTAFTNAPANTLGFFWGHSGSASITTTRGIGINSNGFSFGTYDTTTFTNNDTNGDWYRVSFTMAEASTAVSGSITRLSGGSPTSDVASFTAVLASALDWSTGIDDGWKITTGATGLGNFDFDNITVDVVPVPEPSAALISLFGLSCGFVRRRR